jgi:deazaflavin-dependent oxidoreductase (nitroreductase family)
MTSTTPGARNQAVIDEFRASGGRVGGNWTDRPLLLLTTTGARTGRPHTTPAMYHRDEDGRLYVFASMGGAPKSPVWYHNLVANADVTVEVGNERYAARARVLEGAERDEVYAAQSRNWPQFGQYQERTTRRIPVIELVRNV